MLFRSAEQFLPHLQATFAQVQGPKVLHQTGGSINHVVDLLPGLAGLVAVAVGSKDDLTQARALIGSELTLIGNLDNLCFPSASPEELYAMALECLRTAAPNGYFILSNAGADISMATAPENLKALLAASNQYAIERGCPDE